METASPVVEAAAAAAAVAAAAAAAAGIAVADKAAAHTVDFHIPGMVVVPGQHSKPPIALPAPVAAIADVAHTLAMPSSTRSAHPQTCLQIAPETSEYPVVVLLLADLEEAHACDAPDQQNAADFRVKAGVVEQSDHQQLVQLLSYHAAGRSDADDTANHTGTAVETARCLEAVEAEADGSGRLVVESHSVGAEEGGERSWQNNDCRDLIYDARLVRHQMS